MKKLRDPHQLYFGWVLKRRKHFFSSHLIFDFVAFSSCACRLPIYSIRSHHIIINTNKHDEDTITVDRGWTGTTFNQATILDDKGTLQQTTAAVAPNKITAMTNVVYVLPKHAKYVQNILRTKGWLDKRYRMIKISLLIENKEEEEEEEENVSDDVQRDTAVPNDKFCADANKICTTQREQLVIAVPIASVSFKEITTVCGDVYILERGQREMPFSTSQYASKVK